MNFVLLMFYFCMLLGGLYVFVFSCMYLLITLLGLEYISLSLYIGFVYLNLLGGFGMDVLIIFLIMVVCEGVLGLSLLVMMVRSSGADYYKVLSLLRC